MDRGVYPLLDHRQWLGRTAVKNKGADLQLDEILDWTLPILEFNEWIFLYFFSQKRTAYFGKSSIFVT
jgi:hypothetical protein